jgi:hypothetical protein
MKALKLFGLNVPTMMLHLVRTSGCIAIGTMLSGKTTMS